MADIKSWELEREASAVKTALTEIESDALEERDIRSAVEYQNSDLDRIREELQKERDDFLRYRKAVERAQKKKRVLEFCKELINEEVISPNQIDLDGLDGDEKESDYNLVSFLMTLDKTQLDCIKHLLRNLAPKTGIKEPSKTPDSPDKIADGRRDAQSDEIRVHEEIIEYQQKHGCRYDEAAAVVLAKV